MGKESKKYTYESRLAHFAILEDGKDYAYSPFRSAAKKIVEALNRVNFISVNNCVSGSLLLKYQEEWKKAKANSKRTTKGGYEKVDLKEWGKMEAFAMIMDDLARLQ